MENSINIRVNMNNYLADYEIEQSIDDTLSSFAARRHAGFLEQVHSSNCKLLQRGKNLSNVHCIVSRLFK